MRFRIWSYKIHWHFFIGSRKSCSYNHGFFDWSICYFITVSGSTGKDICFDYTYHSSLVMLLWDSLICAIYTLIFLLMKSHEKLEWSVTGHILIISLVLSFSSQFLSLKIYSTVWSRRYPDRVCPDHLTWTSKASYFPRFANFLKYLKASKEICVCWLLPKPLCSKKIKYVSICFWYKCYSNLFL